MNNDTISYARSVADAVLYEGYLLYPYRASSSKNQSRWQFGVLGPPGALEAGTGEDAVFASQFLVCARDLDEATVAVHLRFLQLQKRSAQHLADTGDFVDVPELVVGEQRWLTWDEATEREITIGPWPLRDLVTVHVVCVDVPAGEDIEAVCDEAGTVVGRLVRTRRALSGELRIAVEPVEGIDDLVRVSVTTTNVAPGQAGDHEAAIASSFIGAHLLVELDQAEAVSLTDPPAAVVPAAQECAQHRCWPVLAGPIGDSSLVLVSPIILYDHPEIAEQSAGALFDSTEIDEILTLRVMTLTDEEKAAARATDPKAAQIIDRCDAMSVEAMQQLHGILRDPHLEGGLVTRPGADVDLSNSFGFDGQVPWWDPAVDGSVAPESDEVIINGVAVSAGSLVTVRPSRRADAQDLFFAGQPARVTAVHSDVDGETHVAVILVDDPAADLHDWYGRYLYFAPDELEPMPTDRPAAVQSDNREESRS